MGFRGSRVRIPPSRFGPRHGGGLFAPACSPPPLASGSRHSRSNPAVPATTLDVDLLRCPEPVLRRPLLPSVTVRAPGRSAGPEAVPSPAAGLLRCALKRPPRNDGTLRHPQPLHGTRRHNVPHHGGGVPVAWAALRSRNALDQCQQRDNRLPPAAATAMTEDPVLLGQFCPLRPTMASPPRHRPHRRSIYTAARLGNAGLDPTDPSVRPIDTPARPVIVSASPAARAAGPATRLTLPSPRSPARPTAPSGPSSPSTGPST